MVLMPNEFPPAQETAVASFTFSELTSGTGFITHYGATVRADTTDDYVLGVNASDPSHWISLGLAPPSDTFTKLLDLDFDILFNLPQRIRGKVRVGISLGGQYTSSTTPNDAEAYTIIKMRKWDGTTETEIAQVQTATLDIPNAGGIGTVISKAMAAEIDTVTLQHFKKGETLRFTVELWGHVPNSRVVVGFGCDPLNRDDTDNDNSAGKQVINDVDNTNLIFQVPFVPDL